MFAQKDTFISFQSGFYLLFFFFYLRYIIYARHQLYSLYIPRTQHSPAHNHFRVFVCTLIEELITQSRWRRYNSCLALREKSAHSLPLYHDDNDWIVLTFGHGQQLSLQQKGLGCSEHRSILWVLRTHPDERIERSVLRQLENLKTMVQARWEFGKFGSREESRTDTIQK